MNFKYRLKTYKDEEGEYSDYSPADKDSILNIIQTHWTNESLPNGLEIISITNDLGQYLLLEHFKNGVFDVYYLPQQTSYHFHKKSTIDIIFNSVDLFFANKLTELENSLNKTKKENKYIRGNFFFIDHNYRYRQDRSIKEGLWLIYALPMGLIISCMGVMSFLTPNALVNFLGIFLFVMGFYFWVPGLLLHLQYKRDIDKIIVKVTKGQEKIRIDLNGKVKELDKRDIARVVKYENPAYRNPWSDYGYAQIEFKNGQVLNLTNLLCDQLFILDKFSQDNIETKTVKKWIPKIVKKTNV
jgi:hypothetical protein